MFTYYGIKSFKCELLSTELFDETPGECHVTESQKKKSFRFIFNNFDQ
jgi:hypothetical protein